jgi:hypothetical protein
MRSNACMSARARRSANWSAGTSNAMPKRGRVAVVAVIEADDRLRPAVDRRFPHDPARRAGNLRPPREMRGDQFGQTGEAGEPVVSDRSLDVIPCEYQIAEMTRHMDEQVSRRAPRALTEGLDASVRDLAAGRVGDAVASQREAKRMLEAFEKGRAGAKDRTRAQKA